MVGREGVAEEVGKVALVAVEYELRWGRINIGARGIRVPPVIIVAIFFGGEREGFVLGV